MKYITFGYCEYERGFTLGFAFGTEQEAKNEIERLRELKSKEPSCISFEDAELDLRRDDYESGEMSLDEIKDVGFEKFIQAKNEWSEKFLTPGMSDNDKFEFEQIRAG